MNKNNNQIDTPIKSKSAYLKILFLKDMEKYKDQPVFYRPIRGSDQQVPVYDFAVFYFFTMYGYNKPQRYTWKFTSTDGKIDDVFQLYPFDTMKFDADPSIKNNLRQWEKIIIPRTDGVVVIAHYYNAFQRDRGEWAGTRAEKDISELRLVVDFSSVITTPGKESLLFRDKPAGFLVDSIEQISKGLRLDYDTGRIFSVSANNVPEGAVLQLNWKLNWENLALWQASTGKENFTPNISFEHGSFPDPYENSTFG